jgi:hypothetical protein
MATLTNFHLPHLSYSPVCHNQNCLLSHELVTLDKNNFGLYYKSEEYPTNLFVRVCNNCLLAKFGLYERDNDNTSFLNCILTKTQHDDKNFRTEGPFLHAYKTIPHVVADESIAFLENTIIIPSGVILMDLFMSDREELFDRDGTIPTVRENGKSYRINPYIYGYLHLIHDLQTAPSTKPQLQLDQVKNFEEILYQTSNLDANLKCLAGTYEREVFMMSNLVHPLAALSNYVTTGTNYKLKSQPKQIDVSIRKNEIIPPETAELASSNKHINLTVTANGPFQGKTKLEVRKVIAFNQIVQTSGLSMRQLIVNRKKWLSKYFNTDIKTVYSAIALHILSFCVPSIIRKPDEATYRRFYPNVTFIEGIGLVSTKDICINETLIANTSVGIDDFIKLKMNSYETGLKYNKLNLSSNILRNSIAFEGRNREEDKACLYANFM